MKRQLLVRILLNLGLILILLGSLSVGALAQEPEARPTVPPRTTPPDDPPPPPTGNGGSDVSSRASVTGDRCASVYGTAINWGFGNQRDVVLHLADGGWQLSQVTADDGYYNFGGLGTGVGILTVESGTPSLIPMINNAAVRLTCNFHTQANIGLYSGEERPEMPAQIFLSAAPDIVQGGQTTHLTIKVQNGLPTPISQVIVTDLFPDGLTIETVDTSNGEQEILANKMLTVKFDSIASGAEENILITLRVADDLSPGTGLQNTATLFYTESAADQKSLTITVAPAESSPSPEQPETLPTASLVVHTVQEGDILYELAPKYGTTFEAIVAQNNITDPRRLQVGQQLVIPAGEGVVAAATPSPADEGPVPETLPVTGLGISLSFAGLLLGLIALLSRGIRAIKNRPH